MEDMGWCRYLTWKRRLSNERQTDGSTDTKKQNSIPWDIPRCYDKLRIWKKGPFGSGQERLCIGGGLKAPPSYSSCERRCSSSQWLKWMMERDLLKARGERANLGAVALSRRCVLYLWPDLLNWSFFPSSLYWNERARDLFSGKWISIRVNALHAAPDWHLIIEIIANRDFHYPLVVDSPSLETKPNLVGDASLCRGIRDAGEYMRSFQPTKF